MKTYVATIIVSAGVHLTAAHGFVDAPSFSCPSNINNECSRHQAIGFDWSDLSTGSFSSYGGFLWTGFTCENSIIANRDAVGTHTNGEKCIVGSASQDSDSCSGFSCDSSQGVDSTSVSEFHIITEFDCELEFHFTMADGSTCKQRSTCSTSGTVIQNSQCGGATNFTVIYPSQPTMPKATCSFSIRSISFDCNSTVSINTISATSTNAITPIKSSTIISHSINQSSYVFSVMTSTSSSLSTPSVVTTVVDYSTLSISSPLTTYLNTGTYSNGHDHSEKSLTVINTVTTTASPGLDTINCPILVPSCLNTWMFSVSCSDNTDTACYCPDVAFVENIFTCMYAYGQTDEIIFEAINYFQGICAPYASFNPAIITGAATITAILAVTPTSAPAGAYTTVDLTTTTTIPCTIRNDSNITCFGSTITISTAMTAPYVAFMTFGISDISLVPGAVVLGTSDVPAAKTTSLGAISNFTIIQPASTGSYQTITTTNSGAIATGGASNVGSGLALLGIAAIAVGAL
ncbi:hypothetical protein BX600DRAFT_515369 [Xylariales sp. PMI_506]|nr:hypothetical protein BX600DRAFT_515369 [Xylariales sp. PMI_506]